MVLLCSCLGVLCGCYVAVRVLLCSYSTVLDGCQGVAMQLLRCFGWLPGSCDIGCFVVLLARGLLYDNWDVLGCCQGVIFVC